MGEIAGLIGAMFWGFTSLLVRYEARNMDVIVLNALRTTVGAAYLVLALLGLSWLGSYTLSFGSTPTLTIGLLLVSVVFSLGAGDSLYFLSMQRIGVARAMPLSMSHPLITSALAVAFLGEVITAVMLGGMALILGGLYLVTMPGRGRVIVPHADPAATRVGIGMALGAAVCWAFSSVAVRPALDQVDALTASTFRVVVGALTVWLVAIWTGRRIKRSQLTRTRMGMALLGGTLTAASMTLFMLCIQLAGVARAATLGATSPIYTVPLSALLLGEQITPRMVVGTLLIVGGVILLVGG